MNAITELTKKLTDGDAELFDFYWRGLLQSPSRLIDACRAVFDARDGDVVATCMTMFEDANSLQLLKGFYANNDGPFAQYTSELDIDSGSSPGCCSIRSRMLRLLRGTSLAIAVANQDFSEVQRCVASMLPNLPTTSEPQWDTSSDPARAVDAWLQNAARAQGVDLSLERDVLNQFCGGFRPIRQPVKLPVLYYHNDVGYCCTLICDALVRGTGDVFPDPKLLTLAQLGVDFVRSVHASWQLACRLFNSANPIAIDVRWSLDLSALPHNNKMPLPVLGDSMGATLATVFMQLLAGEEVDNHWALTAAVDGTGKLSSVGGVEAKAREWFRTFKHIRQLLVTEKDAPDAKAGARAAGIADPEGRVHTVRTIQEVASRLVDLERLRYGTTRRRPPLDVRFTGRAKIFNRVQSFIEDCDSRYLVLSGGMGRGKTQLMSKLIHDAFNSGDRPVYHMISQNQSVEVEEISGNQPVEVEEISGNQPVEVEEISGNQPVKFEEVGRSLGRQLRRKYGHDLPGLTDDLGLTPLLEEINAWLVEKDRIEVLYIDAPDQLANVIGESRRGGLLPGVLPADLPSQFRCVVTSRYDQQWYRQTRGVLFENLEAHTDDRQDVRTYLVDYGQKLEPPLSQKLIDAIVSNTHRAPVFFTVRKCLDQYGENELLRQDAELWLREPEVLIDEAVSKLEADAEVAKLKNSQVWETLALVPLAGEPLSEDQLDDLALWEPDVTDKVLKLAASFFRPMHSSSTPIEFDHPGYERVVLAPERLKKNSQRKKVLTRLLDACRNWRELDEARGYALRQLPRLLTELKEWSELVQMFRDLEYLEARIEPGGDAVNDLATDFRNAIAALPDDQEFVWQLRLLSEALQQETLFLAKHPECLFQCLWNICWWYDCEEAAGYDSTEWTHPTSDSPGKNMHSPKLFELMKQWKEKKHEQHGFMWVRALRPPILSLLGIPHSVELEDSHRWRAQGKFIISGDEQSVAMADCFGNAVWLSFWDASTGKVLKKIRVFNRRQHPQDSPLSFSAQCFSKTGEFFAAAFNSAHNAYEVRIWDTENEVQTHQFECGEKILALIFSPDHRSLVASCAGESVFSWDLNTGTLRFRIDDHGAAIRCLAISADGQQIAGGLNDGTVCAWDAENGRRRFRIAIGQDSQVWMKQKTSVQRTLFEIDIAIEKDQVTPASSTGSEVQPVCTVAYSQNDRWIAASTRKGTYILDNQSEGLSRPFKGHACQLLSFSGDSDQLLGAQRQDFQVWDVETGHLCESHSVGEILDAGFSKENGKPFLLAGTLATNVRLLHFDGETRVSTPVDHLSPIKRLALSPDGKKIASLASDGVLVWDGETGELISKLRKNHSTYRFLAFSRDNHRLAVVAENFRTRRSAIDILDATNGDTLNSVPVARFDMRLDVVSITFSSDSKHLAAGFRSGEIEIRDIEHPEAVVLTLKADRAARDLAFSHDGRYLAAAGHGGSVWEVKTGHLLFDFSIEGWIDRVAFSPDDSRLLCRSVYGTDTIYVLDVREGLKHRSVTPVGSLRGTDVLTALADPQNLPYRLVSTGSECTVVSAATEETVATLSARLREVYTYRCGRTWVAAQGTHLQIFTLEESPKIS